jgi:hypothetical protein
MARTPQAQDSMAQGVSTQGCCEAGPMSLLEQLHSEHKARRARLFTSGKVERPEPKQVEVTEPPAAVSDPKDVVAWGELREVCGKLPKPSYPSMDRIKRIVAAHYNITVIDIVSARRNKKCMMPRHVAIYLSRVLTPASYPIIGRHFGGRDHTTALNSVSRVDERIKNDPPFSKEMQILRQRVLETL